jgi:hypothetical protein
MQVFSKEWFKEHQFKLVRFANTFFGKMVFGIGLRDQVMGITPSSVTTLDAIDFKRGAIKGKFSGHSSNIYAARLSKRLSPVWASMHFIDWVALDRQQLIPDFGFVTYTYGTSESPDYGYFSKSGDKSAWSTLRDATTAPIYQTNYHMHIILEEDETTASKWDQLVRGFITYDTTNIPSGANVLSASLTIDGHIIIADDVWGTNSNQDIMLTEGTPANPANVVADDFDQFIGTTLYTKLYDWNGSSFSPDPASENEISIDISAVQVNDYSCFGFVYRGDYNNVTPLGTGTGRACNVGFQWNNNDTLLTVEFTAEHVKINIGDSWKVVESIQINIGDSWKTLAELKINIGDVWKDIII